MKLKENANVFFLFYENKDIYSFKLISRKYITINSKLLNTERRKLWTNS